ncbi:MAG: hypothetical protein ACJAUH_002804, partial [Saprospiraceae bacterium]
LTRDDFEKLFDIFQELYREEVKNSYENRKLLY